MGTTALAVAAPGAPRTLRLYCHAPPRALRAPPAARTFLALNLGTEATQLDLGGGAARVWLLDAPAPDARTVTINGKARSTRRRPFPRPAPTSLPPRPRACVPGRGSSKRTAAPRRGRRPPPTPTASCQTSPGTLATASRWSCPRAPRCSLSCKR